jgi:tetratricopeptide (TPR) repeat protein
VAEWAAELYPFSAEVAHQKAEVLYYHGCYLETLEQLEKSLALYPMDSNSKLLKTRILIEMSHYDRATEVLESTQASSPSATELGNIYLRYATIYEHLDDHVKMFESLCCAIRSDLGNEATLERLGVSNTPSLATGTPLT